jgi:hypothetical protein
MVLEAGPTDNIFPLIPSVGDMVVGTPPVVNMLVVGL